MTLRISYTYQDQPREIPYANDRYHDVYEAIAAAEGIDLTSFLAMEQQVMALSKSKATLKNYRENYFLDLGFDAIEVIKE